MPRSKRSKLVTLAQTDKKTRENKTRIFDEVRSALDEFKYVWVLKLDDVRTPVLQDIRSDWTGSKLILGKRRVLEKALGDSPEDEYKDNLHKLSKLTTGVSYTKQDYSRAKSKAPIDFTIPEGIVYSRGGQIPYEEDVPMSHSLEETLRNKLKIPTRIKADVRQALILKQFGIAASEFKVPTLAYYDNETTEVTKLD
ncbi:mRNA turnover and ribosome assembly protein [Cerrena zonata]|uniref:mRNA turnover and ribosome assembly protein n=1 Tax=Cerrena zonata TaxID=2478898 RepID=A0AAW0FKA3_9APHY